MNERNLGRIPHTCGLKVRAVYATLKTAERNAADFILQYPEEIKDLTIIELARRARCSEATIVRLSKRLGYSGFPELKSDFAEPDMGNDVGLEYKGISKQDSPEDVVQKVVGATVDALRDTLSIMDPNQYRKALKAIVGATNILFCGVGDAALVAMEAFQHFTRVGQSCCVSEDPDQQLIMATHLIKGDVVVAISHSGKSVTVLNTVKMAKQTGATVIAITNFPVSPLTKNSDIILLTAVFTQHVTGEVISKRVAELCIIESLYINYLLQKGPGAIRTLQAANEAVKVNKLWT